MALLDKLRVVGLALHLRILICGLTLDHGVATFGIAF